MPFAAPAQQIVGDIFCGDRVDRTAGIVERRDQRGARRAAAVSAAGRQRRYPRRRAALRQAARNPVRPAMRQRNRPLNGRARPAAADRRGSAPPSPAGAERRLPPRYRQARGRARNSLRSPGAAIGEGEDVPADAADRLCQIEIVLTAGQAVEQQHHRLGRPARCRPEQGVHAEAAQPPAGGCGGMGGVAGRVAHGAAGPGTRGRGSGPG